MAYTTADLTALQDAIKSGVMTVKHRDRVVTYRSLAEMEKIEAKMKSELGLTGKRRNNPLYSNGL